MEKFMVNSLKPCNLVLKSTTANRNLFPQKIPWTKTHPTSPESPTINTFLLHMFMRKTPRENRDISVRAVYGRVFPQNSKSLQLGLLFVFVNATVRAAGVVCGVDTHTYTGDRSFEILLFLRLYEPYHRLLRLFRFNDRSAPGFRRRFIVIPQTLDRLASTSLPSLLSLRRRLVFLLLVFSPFFPTISVSSRLEAPAAYEKT